MDMNDTRRYGEKYNLIYNSTEIISLKKLIVNNFLNIFRIYFNFFTNDFPLFRGYDKPLIKRFAGVLQILVVKQARKHQDRLFNKESAAVF